MSTAFFEVERDARPLERLDGSLNVYKLKSLVQFDKIFLEPNKINEVKTGVHIQLPDDVTARFISDPEALYNGIEVVDYLLPQSKVSELIVKVKIHTQQNVAIGDKYLLGYLVLVQNEYLKFIEQHN